MRSMSYTERGAEEVLQSVWLFAERSLWAMLVCQRPRGPVLWRLWRGDTGNGCVSRTSSLAAGTTCGPNEIGGSASRAGPERVRRAAAKPLQEHRIPPSSQYPPHRFV